MDADRPNRQLDLDSARGESRNTSEQSSVLMQQAETLWISTSEKNCTEMMQLFDFPSAVLYGIIYEKASLISSTGYHCTHGHEVTMQFRRPGQSFFISKTC